MKTQYFIVRADVPDGMSIAEVQAYINTELNSAKGRQHPNDLIQELNFPVSARPISEDRMRKVFNIKNNG